jgi:hypothetical protein
MRRSGRRGGREAAAEVVAEPRAEGEGAVRPYRGLARFEPRDADLFFDRGQLTDRRLAGSPRCSARRAAASPQDADGDTWLIVGMHHLCGVTPPSPRPPVPLRRPSSTRHHLRSPRPSCEASYRVRATAVERVLSPRRERSRWRRRRRYVAIHASRWPRPERMDWRCTGRATQGGRQPRRRVRLRTRRLRRAHRGEPPRPRQRQPGVKALRKVLPRMQAWPLPARTAVPGRGSAPGPALPMFQAAVSSTTRKRASPESMRS